MIDRSRRARAIVIFCGLLFLVLILARPALAGGSNDPECPFEDPEDCAAWYAAQDYGATPTTPPVQGAPAVTTVTKNIINLGSQSLVRAYQGVLDAMVAGSIGHLETELRPGFSFGFSTILQYSSAGLAGVGFFGNNLEVTTYTIWTKVLAVAGAFFPLLIVANIAQVYTSGSNAPVARAEMFQSLIFSLGRFALAGASYWLGNHPVCGNLGWAVPRYPSEGREGIDRRTITLEPKDEALIQQVYAANPHTVMVLVSSFPYAIQWAQQNLPAIVHMTHNSQEMGNALADVLFGDYNPGGRLVQTWPQSLDQVPPLLDYNIRNNRTYLYFRGEPLYPFGYGLSYTTFEYKNLRTSSDIIGLQDSIEISVEVKNTGSRAGEEVVQMYICHLNSTIERPNKSLKRFQRIAISPGETQTVKLTLSGRDLAFWDATQQAWVVEEGQIQVMVGSSSADPDLPQRKTIAVTP